MRKIYAIKNVFIGSFSNMKNDCLIAIQNTLMVQHWLTLRKKAKFNESYDKYLQNFI